MKKTFTSLALAAAALLAAQAAHAQVYGGVGIGPSRIDINCSGTTSCDKNDTGFKLYGGWGLPGPFSIEAVYFDWGKAKSTGGAFTSLDTKARGIGFDGAYSLLFGWGECMFRAGLVYNRAKTTTVSGGVGSTNTHNYTAPHAGADCAYPFAPNLWATGGVDVSRIKYTASDKADVMLFTIGLRWK